MASSDSSQGTQVIPPDDAARPAGGHLSYYVEQGISPVLYAMASVEEHFERRDSLYRALGLPPIAFQGADVLEVACGSGQNSLYVASCLPASLTLVEPNPTGLEQISSTYGAAEVRHTPPTVVASTLESFTPGRAYDIVLCENWLGQKQGSLVAKLASLTAPGGALVLTTVPLSGFFANVMRRLIALRLTQEVKDFGAQTALLTHAFETHLETIPSMTRTHRDWVQDCMVNPHYLTVALSLDEVFGMVADDMEALGVSPRFFVDWRWFKSQFGAERQCNATLREAATANLHNFIDYRRIFPVRSAAENAALDTLFTDIHSRAVAWQGAHVAGDSNRRARLGLEIGDQVSKIASELRRIDPQLAEAVLELLAVWGLPDRDLSAERVRMMKDFSALFGRETVYLSMTKRLVLGPKSI